MSISVVVIAKNAEKFIARTLKSVTFADEVILVDIKSSDQTQTIAKKYCDKLISYKEDSQFVEPVRNFALSKATKEWILVLDADEEIMPTLATKLQTIAQNNDGEAYYLARKNIVSGAWMQHTGWWPDYQLRFFKKGLVTWSTKIHSQPLVKKDVKVNFLPAEETLALLHHNYKNIEEYLTRFNRYTSIEAEQKVTELRDNFSISPSALLKVFSDDWLRRFFAREGYKDGVRGFYLSLLQAVYQMTVQMKIFDLLDNKDTLEQSNQQALIRDLRHFQKELNYWLDDLAVKETKGPKKLLLIIKRKLFL